MNIWSNPPFLQETGGLTNVLRNPFFDVSQQFHFHNFTPVQNIIFLPILLSKKGTTYDFSIIDTPICFIE